MRPEDDFDHDGASNLAEFLAGTDPTWDLDVLAVDTFVYLPAMKRFGVGFYSVRNKTYELEGSETLTDWQRLAFATNATSTAFQSFWRGDGYYSWMFADNLTNSLRLFRLKAQ